MGYKLKIEAFVYIKRTEEEKKALEDKIKELENETSKKGDIISYDVRTKKKVYKLDDDLEYLKCKSKDYFIHSDDMDLEFDKDIFILINAIKEFYKLDFPCYKYEGIPLEDLKNILTILKPKYDDEDEKDVQYVRNNLIKFINGINNCLEQVKIDNSKIVSFTFNFSLK